MSAETFQTFKESFTKFQHALNLDEYSVFFRQGKLKDCFAQIQLDDESPVASVVYAEKLTPAASADEDPIRTARHEAIHMLLWKLERMARNRFVTDREIREEIEGLTIKLEKLIKDV